MDIKLRDILDEESGSQKRFREQLKKFGVSSIKELNAEDKKKFFNGLRTKKKK